MIFISRIMRMVVFIEQYSLGCLSSIRSGNNTIDWRRRSNILVLLYVTDFMEL